MKMKALCMTLAASVLSASSGAQTTMPASATVAPVSQPASFTPPSESVLKQIDSIFNDERFSNAFWGAVIESIDTGEVWYERNANKLLMPASNEKILTSAATLMTLGPDWKFTTILSTNGTIENGVLTGDLIATADGDPTLSNETIRGSDRPPFFDDPRTPFRSFARQLKEKGIATISGNIVGNDDLWEESNFDDDWPMSGIPTWYSAEFGPLALNENYIDINITPPADASGDVTLEFNLPSSYYTVDNRLKVVTEGSTNIDHDRKWGSRTIVLTGQVKAGDKATEISPSVPNPTAFYAHVLKEVLEDEGITVKGDAFDIDELENKPKGTTELLRHESAPLADILAGLMKRSQNMYAENMPRVLAHQETGQGTFRAGREVVRKRLAELGVSPDQFTYTDGSGLSRYDLVTPRAITEIMKGMHKHEHSSIWHEIMPIAGVDGTLANRMKGTAAEKNVHAKTGTISNVRALSGYVTTAEGELIAFSFIVNSHTASGKATEEVTDGVLELLANYPGGKKE